MSTLPTFSRIAVLLVAITCAMVKGDDVPQAAPAPYAADDYAFVRVFQAAAAMPEWAEATTPRARLWLVREQALSHGVDTDPVSDRYLITLYGGPIDLVHLFGLTCYVLDAGGQADAALYKQWKAEGGRDFELLGYDAPYNYEAHPDDLPSNALGALLAQDLRRARADASTDLLAFFSDFVRPLVPAPDVVARRFSHARIVMGIPPGSPIELRFERSVWFTAQPLVQTTLLNDAARATLRRPLGPDAADGVAALARAGLRLHLIDGRPIRIVRIPPT